MAADIKISIILPVLNDQESLTFRLEEFRKNPTGLGWELIVVDDGSNTPLSLGPDPEANWTLIRQEAKQGAAVSRNKGAGQARGDFLIFLSVFLRLPKDYLDQASCFIDKEKPVYGAHPIVLDPKLPANNFQTFLNAPQRRDVKDGQLSVKQSPFAATIIKRSVFEALGGFDKNMQHYGGHELDLAYRMDLAGYHKRLVIDNCPLVRVAVSDHENIQTRLREYGRIGLPNLLKKHPELGQTILLYPALWSLIKGLGLTTAVEKRLARQIDQNEPLSHVKYRLYLHLLMRNAWDAR